MNEAEGTPCERRLAGPDFPFFPSSEFSCRGCSVSVLRAFFTSTLEGPPLRSSTNAQQSTTGFLRLLVLILITSPERAILYLVFFRSNSQIGALFSSFGLVVPSLAISAGGDGEVVLRSRGLSAPGKEERAWR